MEIPESLYKEVYNFYLTGSSKKILNISKNLFTPIYILLFVFTRGVLTIWSNFY